MDAGMPETDSLSSNKCSDLQGRLQVKSEQGGSKATRSVCVGLEEGKDSAFESCWVGIPHLTMPSCRTEPSLLYARRSCPHT